MLAGIPFEQRSLDMRSLEHQAAEYRALNPAGLIPTLLTPDNQALYETPAIMLHLAEQHQLADLAPSVGSPDRGLFLSALFFIAGELHPHCKRVLYPSRYSLRKEDRPGVVAQARNAAFERVQAIEQRIELSGGPFQLGARFTLLDICLAYYCLGMEDLLIGSCPRVLECMRLVQARPKLASFFDTIAVQRAVFELESGLTAPVVEARVEATSHPLAPTLPKVAAVEGNGGYVLYGGPLTRAIMVELVFIEAGIPFEKINVKMGQHQEHQTSEYKALTGTNAGLIPVVLTPDSHALYETPAIMLYLAEQHQLTDLAPSVGDPDRGPFLSALFFIAGELHPHTKRHWYPSRYVLREADEANMAAQAQAAAFERVQVIEQRIEQSGGPYQLGERFSLVDICLTFFCLPSTGGADGVHELVKESCPRVLELMRLVRARPKIASRWEHLTNNERAEFNAAQGLPPALNEE